MDESSAIIAILVSILLVMVIFLPLFQLMSSDDGSTTPEKTTIIEEEVPKLQTEILYGTSDPLLNLYVSWDISSEESFFFDYIYKGYMRFRVSFVNTTNEFVKIVWENSSIIYGEKSHLLFVTGQKYSDATEPMPPTVVPPNTTIKNTIYSADQLYYKHTNYGSFWSKYIINYWNVKIILCVQSGDKEEYYTIHVKPVEEVEETEIATSTTE